MIYVVQDGQIVESGKHQDLMAKQGEYYQLVTVQMLAEEELEGNDAIDDIGNYHLFDHLFITFLILNCKAWIYFAENPHF